MFSIWYDVSFLWGLGVFASLAAMFFLRSWWVSRRLETEAREDWNYRVSQNMQDLRLTEDAYVRAYTKVNAPRGSKYLGMAMLAIVALSIPAFALMQALFYNIWVADQEMVDKVVALRGRLRVLADPVIFWEFCIFLAVIAFWVLTMWFFLRQYYKRSPGLMRDALIYERAGFMPEVPLTVGANPVHLDANLWEDGDTRASTNLRGDYKTFFSNVLNLTKTIDKDWNGTGHVCETYTDGSGMFINVHSTPDGIPAFSRETHPFFFPGEFARHDDKPKRYTIIALSPDAFKAVETIKATDLDIRGITGSKTSRKISFKTDELDVHIYDSRG